MAGSGLVRIRGGGPFIIYGREWAGKNEGGGTIIYSRGWAGKNEGGGGTQLKAEFYERSFHVVLQKIFIGILSKCFPKEEQNTSDKN